jgi:hypothetical protein
MVNQAGLAIDGARHRPYGWRCFECGGHWPCDTVKVEALKRAVVRAAQYQSKVLGKVISHVEAERDTLHGQLQTCLADRETERGWYNERGMELEKAANTIATLRDAALRHQGEMASLTIHMRDKIGLIESMRAMEVRTEGYMAQYSVQAMAEIADLEAERDVLRTRVAELESRTTPASARKKRS